METIILILGALGIVMAFVWWVWTMNTINKVIEHRVEEQHLIRSIIEDLKELKKLFREIR
jgi:Flp pilus assembly protein TadB